MNPLDSKRILWAWAMYDLPIPFTTLVVTFIMVPTLLRSFHLTKFWVPNIGLGVFL